MIDRTLNILKLLEKKSIFLFGPRGSGKSTLIRQQLGERALVINLLRSNIYLNLSEDGSQLESMIEASPKAEIIVIDEIQRIPELLNEVHRLIEERGLKFLLTGSSARKLRRGGANLLAGRAWRADLFPLCSAELLDVDLDRYLRFGGLPAVYQSSDPEEELIAYVDTYLREEVMAEALVRRLPPFARFLRTIALANGQILNFTKLASDAQMSPSTFTEHVYLLEDTLVGFLLPPWTESKKRKAIHSAKFYFFDPGVRHALADTKTIDRNSNLYGESFEQFISMELRAYISYRRKNLKLRFWRSVNGDEVDFLIGEQLAIEVKATKKLTPKDYRGLLALKAENIFQRYVIVSQDPLITIKDGIHALPWQEFLKNLWADALDL